MPYEMLLGGVRAGKSALAERLASGIGAPVVVVATAEAGDTEMVVRIARHRDSRPTAWGVVEEPIRLAVAVGTVDPQATIILDCLTLWVSNALTAGDVDIVGEAVAIVTALAGRPGWAVVVSNEVGSGIVPANALARRYVEELGRVNAVFASSAHRSRLVVAGKTLELTDP